jgi:hypothetical protein
MEAGKNDDMNLPDFRHFMSCFVSLGHITANKKENQRFLQIASWKLLSAKPSVNDYVLRYQIILFLIPYFSHNPLDFSSSSF